MKALRQIAFKEFRGGLRNRWVAALIVTLTGLALVLALVGAAPGGGIKASTLSVTVVSLASLSVYLLPLIALMLSYDSVVGEAERGTLSLLLSYPVARWQVCLGKFLGHLMILALAIAVGYGATGVFVAVLWGADEQGWLALAVLCGSSLLLGGTFVAFGQLISVLVRQRSTAAGLALGLWLGLVVIYDLVLFGVLLLDVQQGLSPHLFTSLLLANPTDSFRVLNLTMVESVRAAGGMVGLASDAVPHRILPPVILLFWASVALVISTVCFARKEV